MPGRYSTRRRRGSSLRPVNSMKNQMNAGAGITNTITTKDIVVTKDQPVTTVKEEVQRGCIIKAIWLSFDVCGLGGTGVLNFCDAYLMKNPGNNLTEPLPSTVGSSNEKKFVFKTWRAMIMRNQDGNAPYHWEGWIKIPKRYQRFGTDDTLSFNIMCSSGVTGHYGILGIYKWYT